VKNFERYKDTKEALRIGKYAYSNVEIVSYDGGYPNLCSGKLVLKVADKIWEFPSHCLSSGGSVSFDKDWNEDVQEGPWDVKEWPDGFPEEAKPYVLEKINDEIPWGCCGGCV